MSAPVLQFKRGNAGVAGTVPSLRPGEPAISLNNFDFFIGIDTSVANNKFFGSHRYWGREDGTNSLRLKLVDKDGTNSVNLKSPDTLAGIVTYTFPATPTDGYFLKTNTTGELSWAEVVSEFNIAADTGTPDTVGTGSTITFVGGTNVNTAVTDNIITINLNNDISISGIATVGSLVCNDGSVFTGSVQIDNNLNVNGNITLGGTSIYHASEDVFVRSKDIILGVTTDISLYPDNATDDTANGGGVAIASSEGTPLVLLDAVGVNTLPTTYKQIVWMKSGTWTGLSTDAFMFNYGVGIGSTQIPAGVRLAVGGVQVTDDTVTATTGNFTNLTGSLVGTISTATALQNAQDFSITGDFITAPTISFNGTSAVALAATITANSIVLGTYTSGDYVASITSGNGLTGGTTGEGSTPTLAVGAGEGIAVNADDVALKNSTNLTNGTILKWDDVNTQLANSLISDNGSSITVGTGVGITQFSASVSTGTSTSSVPTSSAVIDYVGGVLGNVDLEFGLAADTGTGTLNTSQTLTVSGTANEVNTSVSGQTITVGLPDAVIVGTSLSAPTVKVATLQHSNGTQAATIDSSGNITASQNLTVSGNLYVNGSTTQVNTDTLTVEDRTIELGRVIAGQPTTTTWDLAVLFNYGDGAAKKAGVVWEASGVTKRFQFTADVNPGADGGPTDTNLPEFTVASFAPIEIGSLWVTDCAGTSQVISCTGDERFLQNITIDAGVF